MYDPDRIRIKDLPEDERPRERLRKHGPEALRDSDLLAIILKSGFQGTTAIQLGEQILMAFEGDLKRMADHRSKQFEKIKGIGEAKAAQIVAALELGKRLARFHAERDKNYISGGCRRSDDVPECGTYRRKLFASFALTPRVV